MDKHMGIKPAVEGLNQLEAAVLLEKYTILLGMINYGTPEQKEQARNEVKTLEGYIHTHVNAMAFEMADNRFSFDQEELEIIEKALV
jgi:hypothetical protein